MHPRPSNDVLPIIETQPILTSNAISAVRCAGVSEPNPTVVQSISTIFVTAAVLDLGASVFRGSAQHNLISRMSSLKRPLPPMPISV